MTKGKVESGVKYLKRNFLAGRTFTDLAAANVALLGWIERVAGRRIHGTTKQRPLERFVAVEKAALLALPSAPYDLGVWKKVKLHPDCHVVIDHAFYSAPHRLIGQQLWVRSNGRDVVIFHDYTRLATHAWGPPGTRRTIPRSPAAGQGGGAHGHPAVLPGACPGDRPLCRRARGPAPR